MDHKEIIFKRIGERELTIDIFSPHPSEHTKTAVILLHGGGWRYGNKSMMREFGRELAKHGFVAFAPEYRLLDEAPWPAQIKDVKSAIRWVRAKAAEWNLDLEKIALEGFSAGGHLALMAAGTPDASEYKGDDNTHISDAISAVVAFFPPVEFSVAEPGQGVSEAQLLLGENSSEEQAQKISPIHFVSRKFPPTFLLHGTADKMVPHITSMRMHTELERYGVPVEMHLYPGHTHEFARLPSMLAATQMEIVLFLHRMVVDPEKYHNENLELNRFAKM